MIDSQIIVLEYVKYDFFYSAVLIDIILYLLGSDFCRPLSRKT